MMMFVVSQSFISLMFVSAAVIEIHDLNQKKNFENGYFIFHGHITD